MQDAPDSLFVLDQVQVVHTPSGTDLDASNAKPEIVSRMTQAAATYQQFGPSTEAEGSR